MDNHSIPQETLDRNEYDLSVVIPVYNEERHLQIFFSELVENLDGLGKQFEVIFVNDGSSDNSSIILEQIAKENDYVKVLNLKKNSGKASSLDHGFQFIRGELVVIMDSDRQYDPSDIKKIVGKLEDGFDAVSGNRVNRADGQVKKFTSWIHRYFVRKLSGLEWSDYFSGLKGFKTAVVRYLGTYGDLNRLFSVYAHRSGFRVCEIPINHFAREGDKSKYNPLGLMKLAFLDIAVLIFTITISKDRIYRVGLWGLCLVMIGGLLFIAEISISFFPSSTAENLLESQIIKVGIILAILGGLLRVLERIGKEFIERHAKEYMLRSNNILTTHNISKRQEAKVLGDQTKTGRAHHG